MCEGKEGPTRCKEICGDGRRVYEQCDDGNIRGGDGCSEECQVEPGYKLSLIHI